MKTNSRNLRIWVELGRMLVKKEKLEILASRLLLACVQLLQAEKDKLEIFLAPVKYLHNIVYEAFVTTYERGKSTTLFRWWRKITNL
jgi:hypothetical protein